MIAEFVMVISLCSPIPNWTYVGTFDSCDHALLYTNLNYPVNSTCQEKELRSTRCLHEDYIYLPEGTVIRRIKLHE